MNRTVPTNVRHLLDLWSTCFFFVLNWNSQLAGHQVRVQFSNELKKEEDGSIIQVRVMNQFLVNVHLGFLQVTFRVVFICVNLFQTNSSVFLVPSQVWDQFQIRMLWLSGECTRSGLCHYAPLQNSQFEIGQNDQRFQKQTMCLHPLSHGPPVRAPREATQGEAIHYFEQCQLPLDYLHILCSRSGQWHWYAHT